MLVSNKIIAAYGGSINEYEKGSYIFYEGSKPNYFFQVIKGSVKVIQYNDKGNEILLGLFSSGETFGEPPLIANKPYPSYAVAYTNVELYKISRDNFLKILDIYPEIMKRLLFSLSNRIIAKSNSSKILISNNAEEKLLRLFYNLKNDQGNISPMIVPYTRQQIANITGLRVETVIRTISKLSGDNKLKIVNRKIQI